MIYKEDTLFCFVDFETTGLNTMTDYPLQIGYILTDVNFNELTRREYLINDPALKGYSTKHLPAYFVHQIKEGEIIKDGLPPVNIVINVMHAINKHKKTPGSRVIMVSDNPRFEWGFMQNLFGDLKVEDVFHYSAESVNLLLHLAGVKKKKEDKAHRAMPDCEELLNCVREAKSILQGKQAMNKEFTEETQPVCANGVRYIGEQTHTFRMPIGTIRKLEEMRLELNEITNYEPVHMKHYEMLFEVKDLLNEVFGSKFLP